MTQHDIVARLEAQDHRNGAFGRKGKTLSWLGRRSAQPGPELPEYAGVREVPRRMLAGMAILAVFVVAFGLGPDLVVDTLIAPAADALLHQGQYIMSVLGGRL